MSRVSGKWGFSPDGEFYHGAFDTKEEAMAEGRDPETSRSFWVAQYGDFVPRIDVEWILDQAQEQAKEECGEAGEDWLWYLEKEKKDRLQAAIQEVFMGWLEREKLDPTFSPVLYNTVEEINS